MRLSSKKLYAALTGGREMTYLGNGDDVKMAADANALPEGELYIIEKLGYEIKAETRYVIVSSPQEETLEGVNPAADPSQSEIPI